MLRKFTRKCVPNFSVDRHRNSKRNRFVRHKSYPGLPPSCLEREEQAEDLLCHDQHIFSPDDFNLRNHVTPKALQYILLDHWRTGVPAPWKSRPVDEFFSKDITLSNILVQVPACASTYESFSPVLFVVFSRGTRIESCDFIVLIGDPWFFLFVSFCLASRVEWERRALSISFVWHVACDVWLSGDLFFWGFYFIFKLSRVCWLFWVLLFLSDMCTLSG